MSPGYLEFKEYAPVNLARLADDLATGNYTPGEPKHFTVLDPKPRLISVIPFRDRVAHHAIVDVIGPIFEATFLPRSYACRAGLGTHAGVRGLQAEMRSMGEPLYALKTDYAKYFASIDRAILRAMIERKISCAATLDILAKIVPPTGIGIPIGSLASQLFANVYGSATDRFIHVTLGQRHWHRYMDDIVVLGNNPKELRDVQKAIAAFSQEALRLRLSKWSVQSVDRGVNFLGYRIWPTHKLLRRQSVTRARRKLKILRARGDLDAIQSFVAAWRGHAQWADSHNLLVDLKLRRARC
jgi:retron-type reverse transcriptase